MLAISPPTGLRTPHQRSVVLKKRRTRMERALATAVVRREARSRGKKRRSTRRERRSHSRPPLYRAELHPQRWWWGRTDLNRRREAYLEMFVSLLMTCGRDCKDRSPGSRIFGPHPHLEGDPAKAKIREPLPPPTRRRGRPEYDRAGLENRRRPSRPMLLRAKT